jgi:hypothetical protein
VRPDSGGRARGGAGQPALPRSAPPPVTPLPRVDAVFADDGVTITDGGKSVLFYRTAPADPREAGRLNYVHPIWAPDGTVLTEDRPADHLHQRGAFWSWHQVLVDGKNVADGWFMKGLTFHVREKRFKGDSAGGGTLVVNADWIINSTPEVDYVARETTKVRVYPLKAGARRIERTAPRLGPTRLHGAQRHDPGHRRPHRLRAEGPRLGPGQVAGPARQARSQPRRREEVEGPDPHHGGGVLQGRPRPLVVAHHRADADHLRLLPALHQAAA